MGKSTDFVIQKLSELQGKDTFELPFDKFVGLTTFSDTFYNGKMKWELPDCKLNGLCGNIIGNITYDENGDFEEYVSCAATGDGSLFVIDELCLNNLNDLIMFEPCADRIAQRIRAEPFDCNVNFTVGNLVVSHEYGDFGTTEKPWLKMRNVVVLPFSCEIIMNDKGGEPNKPEENDNN